MADFSIISDTSTALLRMFRGSLCPDPILSPESIVLISPSDKNGDFQMGLHLYDIKELTEYRSTVPVYKEANTRTRPPKALSLYYTLFVNQKAQISAGAEMEQRIFGRIIQSLTDTSILRLSDANPYLEEGEEETTISMLSHSFEDKVKIWSALQCPYQVAVFMMASPVLLSSRKEEKIGRVTDTKVEVGLIAKPGVHVGGSIEGRDVY